MTVTPAGRPIVGQLAPTIALNDLTGAQWRSSDHLGSFVVVIFHRHLH